MSLYSARADLAEALGRLTGYRCDDHVPSQVSPPCLFIEPGPGYIAYSDASDPNEYEVALRLWVVVELRDGSNDAAANELDTALKTVLDHLPETNTVLTGTGQPGPIAAQGWLAHGVYLDLATLTTI